MRDHDLEGIVAKRLADPYEPRTRWLKIKNPDYSSVREEASCLTAGDADEELHRSADDARQRSDRASPRDRLVSRLPAPNRAGPGGARRPLRRGAAVIDWVKRLKCSQCGSRSVDFVLTGARR
jgi:hypothetical protein